MASIAVPVGACTDRPAAHARPGKGRMRPFLLIYEMKIGWCPTVQRRSDRTVMASHAQSALANLDQAGSVGVMRVNVGEAKTNLSRLLARVEAGEDVEIARDGVPVARLVRVEREMTPGEKFLTGAGEMAGQILISEDFEFSEQELDQMYAEMDEDDELV